MPRPYLILAHDYRRTSAGVRVLHRLCHFLNEAGYDAWITPAETDPELNTPIADDDVVGAIARDGIVVYAEVEDGNPLEARRVARYLLNVPGRIRKADFTEGEETFYYCGLLRRHAGAYSHMLFIPVVNTSTFHGDQAIERDGPVLSWIGKGNDTPRLEQTTGALPITYGYPATAEVLARLFQRAPVFYSYQPYSALVIEARLCGCPTVVIPNDWWTKEDFLMHTPGGINGLAWGTDQMQLQRARAGVTYFPESYGAYVHHHFARQLERFIVHTQRMESNK